MVQLTIMFSDNGAYVIFGSGKIEAQTMNSQVDTYLPSVRDNSANGDGS